MIILLTGDVYLYLFEQKFKANHKKSFGFHNLNSNLFFFLTNIYNNYVHHSASPWIVTPYEKLLK